MKCACGKPLHYKNKVQQHMVQRFSDQLGAEVEVEIGDREDTLAATLHRVARFEGTGGRDSGRSRYHQENRVNCLGQRPVRHKLRQQFRSVGVLLLLFTFAWAVPTFVLDDDPSDDANSEFVVSVPSSERTMKLVCLAH